MQLSLRDRLAFPAGVAPGIDPSHPASKNCYLSAVPGGGGNYFNLLTGAPFTLQTSVGTTGLATPVIDDVIGPALSFASLNKAMGIAFSKTVGAATFAAIIRFIPSGTGSYQTLVAFSGSFGLWIHQNGTNSFLDVFGSSADHDAPFSLVAGTYFVCASVQLGSSGQPVHYLAKNLATGQVQTGDTAANIGNFTPTQITVGIDSSDEFSGSPIARGMFSEVALSPQQMLEWAEDPWAFWNPNANANLVGVIAGGFTMNVTQNVKMIIGP